MIDQQRVYSIRDLDSLLCFLRDDLHWTYPEASIEDVSFEWTGLDLNLSEDINKKLKGGMIRQLQPFAANQPWGVFVIEFATADISIITLRQILRCFVAKKRAARSDLPAWKCENLLFICLYGDNGFTFAHFKGIQPYSARLTTFSWHPGDPIRTVCEFNLPALVFNDTWTSDTWVSEWQKAFDVEKVNKDFYRQIAHFYYRLTGKEGMKRELVLPSVADDTGSVSIYEEFAVRLIGRTVFCWFLKHKVSEKTKVPLIPPEALSCEAARKIQDYYHFILEPLFFEVMNKHVKDRKKLNVPRAEVIPFLNGGLFEQHPHDFYDDQPNFGLKIPDTWFIEFFTLLERYNFTITENSSIDVDVAVDPEMLGRIFENLLAEVVPETSEIARRKETGSYYTPRSIVNYMVEQSLRQYLITMTTLGEIKVDRLFDYSDSIDDFSPDEKLAVVTAFKECKIIDPACGSGAFPIGILHRMLSVLEKVDPRLELWREQYLDSLDSIVRKTVEKNISRENWRYIRKLMIIRDSIYGVDIQPVAVEIAKLRCFLSLVVDEKIADKENNRGIEPLPNLEFKFVAANTLIGLPEITDMGIMENKELINELVRLRKEYFSNSGNKEQLKSDFRIVQAKLGEYFRNLLITEKTDFTGVTRKLEAKGATQTQLLSEWDPFSYKASPWFDSTWIFGVEDGFDIVIANPPYIRIHKQNKDTKYKELMKKSFVSAHKDYDIYVLFMEKGLSLLKNDGLLTFITPDKYLVREYGEKIRQLILDYTILELFDISRADDVFNAAVYPLISIIQKNQGSDEIRIKVAKTIRNINYDFREMKLSKRICKEKNIIELINPADVPIVNKIYSQSRPLRDVLEDNQIFCGTPRARDYYQWAKYVSSQSKEKDCLRVLVCSNLTPYRIDHNRKVRTLGLSLYRPYFNRKDKVIPDSRWNEFSTKPKILIRGNDTRVTAVLDEIGSVFIGIYGINIGGKIRDCYKYVLSSLNSKLYQWIFLTQNPSIRIGGGYFSINSPHILRLPFKEIASTEQLRFNNVVDQILAITKDEDYLSSPVKQSKVKEYERQIDEMVYELYGLTPEEIAIVEGESS